MTDQKREGEPEKIKSIVSKVVRNMGYQASHSSNWSKEYPDVLHIIGLQKSRWGLEYYLEAAIWLKTFGPDESPKHYECHVKTRFDSDFGLGDEIDSALNEEDYSGMDPNERRRIISETLWRGEAEFFGRAKTLEDLRELIVNRPKFMLAVNKCVLEFFNLPLPP